MRKLCSIDGCEQESRGRGWCATHWARWKKHGDPLVTMRPGVDYMVKGACSVEGCDRPNHAHNLCSMHLTRFEKYGDPTSAGSISGRPLSGDVPKFATIHKRLTRTRGSASMQRCIDCGGPAQEWSYNNADSFEVYEVVGKSRVAYSLDLANYSPRCIKCHRKFDGGWERRERDAQGRFTDQSAHKYYADDEPYVTIRVGVVA